MRCDTGSTGLIASECEASPINLLRVSCVRNTKPCEKNQPKRKCLAPSAFRPGGFNFETQHQRL